MEDTALERKGRRRCCSLSFVFHSSLTYAGLQNCALEIHARQQRFHVCNVHTCNTSGGGTKPRCLQQSRFTPPQNTHIHTYTDTHTCTHTHTHTHAYTRTHTHAYTRIHTRTHTHTHAYTHTSAWLCCGREHCNTSSEAVSTPIAHASSNEMIAGNGAHNCLPKRHMGLNEGFHLANKRKQANTRHSKSKEMKSDEGGTYAVQ